MERIRTTGGILALLCLVLVIVFVVLGKLALIPGVLIGMLALALVL